MAVDAEEALAIAGKDWLSVIVRPSGKISVHAVMRSPLRQRRREHDLLHIRFAVEGLLTVHHHRPPS